MRGRPAAGGGRWVDVDPERLRRWLERFEQRHGSIAVDAQPYGLRIAAVDGALAEWHTPPGALTRSDLDAFVAAAVEPRRVGLVLVRRGGAAIGLAHGDRLVESKVDGGYVQSRTAAGGWSQQRFARRRDNQTRSVAERAVEHAARLLVPVAAGLAAVVGGGDRRLVDTVFADARLKPLVPLRDERFLEVPDPRLAVLVEAARQARAVRIRVTEPDDR
ncbi:MAG TPA: acVLRF1 family peptidyl-tRNA hydrolase [Micromonosporaceae bacterium]